MNVVLSFMREAGLNFSLSFQFLTKKLVTLLAVTTLLRTSEIASLEAGFSETDSGVSLTLSKPRKTQTNGPLKIIALVSYSDKAICPVDCLRTYVYYTDVLRSSSNSNLLLVGLIQPFNPVSGNTVGRWIKDFLSDAGIDTDTFSAHSTRGAAASKAAASGISVDSILRAGDWSNEVTFAKFYNRDIVSPEATRSVLINL